ncbi:MAG TPA: hypothetical protein VN700_16640 [Vicinamibacterales bacterium]|nr:hypothetical protein [Vicinamibacterales bacterium]
MPDANAPADRPVFGVGDVLIAKMPDGSFQISRVSANGRSSHVMGCQSTAPAAMRMATSATSGPQRVFLKGEGESGEYSLVA